ncbi:MAG: GDP-mannose 4,6-dehydratase [Leptospira sp.]|nr:GDP-mannose 4,6-dehydratase [Leptospira sp.]
MRTLITGGTGFVGNYLISLLNEVGNYDIQVLKSDIRDKLVLGSLIKEFVPERVYHLAAQAFVPKAIEDPWETESVNVLGTLNLLENLHRLQKPVRMVYVSSADVYGRQDTNQVPFREDLHPNPMNPYSGSKLAAESYCRQYATYDSNLNIVLARPFNHIGVGQRKEFVIPNFCHQILEAIEQKLQYISVGDLSPSRDFLNVKDVASAYLLLIEKGVSGEIYNICSGKEISIRAMADKLLKFANVNIEYRIDEARIRKAETSRLFGDNTKLSALGWSPKLTIDETLKEIFESIVNIKSI